MHFIRQPFLFDTAENIRFNLPEKVEKSRFQLTSEAKIIINIKQNHQIPIFLKLEKTNSLSDEF